MPWRWWWWWRGYIAVWRKQYRLRKLSAMHRLICVAKEEKAGDARHLLPNNHYTCGKLWTISASPRKKKVGLVIQWFCCYRHIVRKKSSTTCHKIFTAKEKIHSKKVKQQETSSLFPVLTPPTGQNFFFSWRKSLIDRSNLLLVIFCH